MLMDVVMLSPLRAFCIISMIYIFDHIRNLATDRLQVNVESRTGGARICVPAWNAVVTAKSEKAGPGL